MKIIAVSDTHHRYGRGSASYPELKTPEGDVLVHAGDIAMMGEVAELCFFNEWLGRQPQRVKLVVPGNHDWLFQRDFSFARSLITNGKVLCDERFVVDDQIFWGSPWQPNFYNWAFQLPRGERLAEKWALIPDDTNFLITHGGPKGFGDRVQRWEDSRPSFDGRTQVAEPTGYYEDVGCEDLLSRVLVVKPKYHVFGHVHVGHGIRRGLHTCFINASICNEKYVHRNPPVVINTKTGTVKTVKG